MTTAGSLSWVFFNHEKQAQPKQLFRGGAERLSLWTFNRVRRTYFLTIYFFSKLKLSIFWNCFTYQLNNLQCYFITGMFLTMGFYTVKSLYTRTGFCRIVVAKFVCYYTLHFCYELLLLLFRSLMSAHQHPVDRTSTINVHPGHPWGPKWYLESVVIESPAYMLELYLRMFTVFTRVIYPIK